MANKSLSPTTINDLEMAVRPTVEKDVSTYDITRIPSTTENSGVSSSSAIRLLRTLASWGVEVHGIAPVPEKDQTQTQYHNLFLLWLSFAVNLFCIVAGMAGTLSYGLSLRDASLTIIFFSLLCYLPTAAMNILGPQTGMRQLVQARYSFGLYPVTVVVLLNMTSCVGFTIMSAVIAGQTLSAVSNGNMSVVVGIILTFLVGLFISFCGYNVLHIFNRWSWVVNLTCFIIVIGCCGEYLSQQVEAEPAGAPLILNYGCFIAGLSVSVVGITSDYSVYYKPTAPVMRMFAYNYLGLNIPTIALMILGAAIGGAVPNVPAWKEGNDLFSTGGVIEAMLRPAGGFGKFITVILAFSLMGNVCASMYTTTLNWQILIPWFARLPRILFSVVTTAISIPIAIAAANNFFTSLENFLALMAYWPAAYSAIIIVEHVYFRRCDSSTYDKSIWKDAGKLPSGFAAIVAGAASFALVVPCMATTWYTGLIAKSTGDIGFEVAFTLAGLLYLPLRMFEIRLQGHL